MGLKPVITLGSVDIYDVRSDISISTRPLYSTIRTVTGDVIIQVLGNSKLDDVVEFEVRVDETTKDALKNLVGTTVTYTDMYGRSLNVFVAEVEEKDMVPITRIYSCIIRIILLEEV